MSLPVKADHDTFMTVGLPDASGAREPRAHPRGAEEQRLRYSSTTTTINLAPADIRKEGSGFDLPMALGILGAYGGLNNKPPEDALFVGRAVARRRPARHSRRIAHRRDGAGQQNSQADRAGDKRARGRRGGGRGRLSGALADRGGAASEYRQRHPADQG